MAKCRSITSNGTGAGKRGQNISLVSVCVCVRACACCVWVGRVRVCVCVCVYDMNRKDGIGFVLCCVVLCCVALFCFAWCCPVLCCVCAHLLLAWSTHLHKMHVQSLYFRYSRPTVARMIQRRTGNGCH